MGRLMIKKLKLSVIIPVYNEERHIGPCLEAVLAQTEPLNEVIVVDNNSSDRTVEIASKYPGVRIIHEKTQGLIPARNRGFAEASADILCRIDADAVLAPDWSKRVRQAFEAEADLAGVTGLALTRVFPRLPLLRTRLYSMGYFWWTWYLFGAQVLWGANMAVSRDWWEKARDDIEHDGLAVHEDQDLSLCLIAKGGRIKLDKKLLIVTDGQTYNYAPKLLSYIRRALKTRRLNQGAGRWPVVRESRLPVWQKLLATTATYTLGMLFLLLSLCLWPVDKFMMTFVHERWID